MGTQLSKVIENPGSQDALKDILFLEDKKTLNKEFFHSFANDYFEKSKELGEKKKNYDTLTSNIIKLLEQNEESISTPEKSINLILDQKNETISFLSKKVKQLENDIVTRNSRVDTLQKQIIQIKLNPKTIPITPKKVLKGNAWKSLGLIDKFIQMGKEKRLMRLNNANNPANLVELIKIDHSPKTLLYVKSLVRSSNINFLVEFIRHGGVGVLINLFLKIEKKLAENVLLNGFVLFFILEIFQILFTKQEIIVYMTNEFKEISVDILIKAKISGASLFKSITYRILCNIFAINFQVGREILEQLSLQYDKGTSLWASIVENIASDENLHVRLSSIFLVNSYLDYCESLEECLILRQKLELQNLSDVLDNIPNQISEGDDGYDELMEQIEIYKKDKQHDEIEYLEFSQEIGNVSLEDPSAIFNRILMTMGGNKSKLSSLLEILKHVLLLELSHKPESNYSFVSKVINKSLIMDIEEEDMDNEVDLTIENMKKILNANPPTPSTSNVVIEQNKVETTVEPVKVEQPKSEPVTENPTETFEIPPPPPSFEGGVPPPPPPLDLSISVSIVPKKVYPCPTLEGTPGNKMKKVRITKLQCELDNTVWKEVHERETTEIETPKLEKLFENLDAKSSSSMPRKNTGEKIYILPPRDTIFLNILLTSKDNTMNKMQISDGIKDGLWKLFVGNSLVGVIKKLMSDNEKLRQDYILFKGDPMQLSDIDFLVRDLFFTPEINVRMNSIIFALKFQEKIAKLNEEVNILRKAANEVKNMGNFKVLLKTILCVINYMNGSNPNTDKSFGFYVKDLNMLDGVKSSKDPNISLLNFLVEQICFKNPAALLWKEEIPSLFLINHDIEKDIKKLKEQLDELMKEDFVKVKKEWAFYTNIFPTLQSFFQEISLLSQNLETANKEFKEVMVYYGEDKLGELNITNFARAFEIFSKSSQLYTLEANKKKFFQDQKNLRLNQKSSSTAPKTTIITNKKGDSLQAPSFNTGRRGSFVSEFL